MKSDLSSQQIADYRENGFLVVEGFLDANELENWRRCTEEAIPKRISTGEHLHNQNDPDSYYAQVFTQAIKLADVHEGMRHIMHDPRLGKVVAEVAGINGVRIWHDQALIKPPFGNATAWHLDNPYWSFSSFDAISIWVALDDATLANGCMWYLPGTQRTADHKRHAEIGQNQRSLFRIYPEWQSIEPVACPCPAGSAVFHNGMVAHGAGANMTNRPRRAMTCAYMPDGSTFNGTRNVLSEAYHNSLELGDVIDDPVEVPLIYKRG